MESLRAEEMSGAITHSIHEAEGMHICRAQEMEAPRLAELDLGGEIGAHSPALAHELGEASPAEIGSRWSRAA